MRVAKLALLLFFGCAARSGPIREAPRITTPTPIVTATRDSAAAVMVSLKNRPSGEVLSRAHHAFASAYAQMSAEDPRLLRGALELVFKDFGWALPVPRSPEGLSKIEFADWHWRDISHRRKPRRCHAIGAATV